MDDIGTPGPELAVARKVFLEQVRELRPLLHRYCARMTGSVLDGEDLVGGRVPCAHHQRRLPRAALAVDAQHVGGDVDLQRCGPGIAPLAHTEAIHQGVARNLEQPRLEAVGRPQGRQVPQDAHEHLLQDIVRIHARWHPSGEKCAQGTGELRPHGSRVARGRSRSPARVVVTG
jgi:hypothetical protein